MCRPCHVIGQLFQWLAETTAPIAPIRVCGLVKDSLIRRISSSSSRRSPGSWMSLTETTIADRQQPPASKQGKNRVRGAAGVAWPLRANRLTTCGSFGLLDFFLLPGRRIPLILPVMPWNLTASHGPQPTPWPIIDLSLRIGELLGCSQDERWMRGDFPWKCRSSWGSLFSGLAEVGFPSLSLRILLFYIDSRHGGLLHAGLVGFAG